MKKTTLILLTLMLVTHISFATNAPSITTLYETAQDLNLQLISLSSTYPDLIHVTQIGESVFGVPIYSLQVTQDASLLAAAPQAFKTSKQHLLIESGIHAREVINPTIMVKVIEGLVENANTNPEKNLLQKTVFHFIPLSNPDGYDLALNGTNGLTKDQESLVSRIFGQADLSLLKANARGVDLNRNFPDTYYNLQSGSWVNIWGIETNKYRSNHPSLAYYHGPSPGSEPETQALATYVQSYDFRAVLSVHSRGQVIFWHTWMHSDNFNESAQSLARVVLQTTGYKDIGDNYDASSGYFGDFVANTLQKPFITIETLSTRTPYDTTDTYHFNTLYKQLSPLPSKVANWANGQGYGAYKVYKEGIYLRDYASGDYAQAVAKKEGGQVKAYPGQPTFYLNPLTRADFINSLYGQINNIEDIHATNTLKDLTSPVQEKAERLGLIKGDLGGHFNPATLISPIEASAILYRLHQVKHPDTPIETDPRFTLHPSLLAWSVDYANFTISKGYFDEASLYVGELSINELKRIYEVLQEN